jgi:hypothetical protein
MNRIIRNLLMLSFFIVVFAVAASRVQGQTNIEVIENSAVLDFPNDITFALELKPSSSIKQINLLYGAEGKSCTSGLARQKVDFTTAGDKVTAEWIWDFHKTDSLPVGVKVDWQWEIIDSNGVTTLIDPKTMTVDDDSQSWKSVSRDGITVMWFEGAQSFGNMLLDIATDSIKRLSENAGIQPPSDIIIVVYPDAEMLKDAILFTSEWVGGQAFPNYGVTMIGIAPGETDWAEEVIPHELAHLVTDSVVFNCVGTYMPTWLSEGLSMYLEGEASASDIASVESALKDGSLFSLRSLAQGFAVSGDKARLAYAFSGEVVRYMIKTYGAEKMAALLAAIQQGNRIDAALNLVYGFDTDWLDLEYRAFKGYAELPAVRFTPSPSPQATAVATLAPIKPGFGNSPTRTPDLSPTEVPSTPADTPLPASTSAPAKTSPLNCLGGNAAVFGLLLLVLSPAYGKVLHNNKEEK